MKAIPLDENYKPCAIENVKHLKFKVPSGEWEVRILPVITKGSRRDHKGAIWTWNGDIEKPTLKPSVLTHAQMDGYEFRCHTWINDGKAKFLGDCSHVNKSKTLDLLDVTYNCI